MASETLDIKITASGLDQVIAGLDKLGGSGDALAARLRAIKDASDAATPGLAALDGAVGDVSKMFDEWAAKIPIVGSALQALGPIGTGVAAALGGIATVMVLANEAAAQAQDTQAKLQAVLTATGGTAGKTADQLDALTQSLSQASVFSPDQIKAAETELLTFGSISGDVFDQALKGAADLAAVTGEDLVTATKQLGLALDNPTAGMTRLQRAGIALSATQKQLIADFMASGNQAGAQQVILEALTEKIGGAAGAEAGTAVGAAAALHSAWTGLLVELGNTSAITAAEQAITKLLNTLAQAGKGPSIAQQIAALQDQISNADNGISSDPMSGAGDDPLAQSALKAKLASLQASQFSAAFAATGSAEIASSAQAAAAFNNEAAAALNLATSLDPVSAALKKNDADQLSLLAGINATKALMASQGDASGTLSVQLNVMTAALAKLAVQRTAILSPTEASIQQAQIEAQVLAAPIAQRDALRAKLEAEVAARKDGDNAAQASQLVAAKEAVVTAQQTAAINDQITRLQQQAAGQKLIADASSKGAAAQHEATLEAQAYADAVSAKLTPGTDAFTQAYQRFLAALKGDDVQKGIVAFNDWAQAETLAATNNNDLVAALANGAAAFQAEQDKIAAHKQYLDLLKQGYQGTEAAVLSFVQSLNQSKTALDYTQQLKDANDAVQVEQYRLSLLGQEKPITEALVTNYKNKLDLEQKFVALGPDKISALEDELNLATNIKVQYDAQVKAQQQFNEVVKSTTDSLVSGAATAFEDMFSGAKKGFSGLTDFMKSEFEKMVAELAAKALLQPIIQPIVGFALSSLGGTGGVGGVLLGSVGGGSAGSDVGDILGLGHLLGLSGGSTATATSGTIAGGGTVSSSSSGGLGNILGLGSNAIGPLFGSNGSVTSFLNGIGADIGLSSGVPLDVLDASTGVALEAPTAATGLLGSTTLSGLLGGAGIGSLAGSVLGLLGIGGSGISSMIGSTGGSLIGAAIGSIIPGVGTIIGGLIGGVGGQLLSGLFGGNAKPSSGPSAGTAVDFVNGKLVIGGSGADKGGNIADTTSLAGQAITAINQILATEGATLVSDPGKGKGLNEIAELLSPSPGSGTPAGYTVHVYNTAGNEGGASAPEFFEQGIASSSQAVAQFVLQYLQNSTITGLGPNVSQVLQTTTDPAQLQSALSTAASLDQIVANAGKTLSTYQSQVEQMSQSFEQAKAQAETLGLATDDLATAEGKAYALLQSNFETSVKDSLDGFTDSMLAQLDALKASEASRVQDAEAVDANMTQVAALNLDERAKLFESFSDQDLATLTAALGSAADATDLLALKIANAFHSFADAVSAQETSLKNAAAAAAQAQTTYANLATSLAVAALNTETGSGSPLAPGQQYAIAQAVYEQTKAQALSGNETALSNLASVSSTFLGASKTMGTSYGSDFNDVVATLEKASQEAGLQSQQAATQTTLLGDQVALLESIQALLANPDQNGALIQEQLRVLTMADQLLGNAGGVTGSPTLALQKKAAAAGLALSPATLAALAAAQPGTIPTLAGIGKGNASLQSLMAAFTADEAQVLTAAAQIGAGFTPSALPDGITLPGHAAGGVFSSPHLAMIAEGGQAEAVVPLAAGAIPVRMSGAGNGDVVAALARHGAHLGKKLDAMADRLANVERELGRQTVTQRQAARSR